MNRRWAMPVIYALLLPGIPLCIKYFQAYYDLYTMNAYRLLAGALFLLVLAFFTQRAALWKAFRDTRFLLVYLLLAAINIAALYVYTVGLFMISATLCQLICVLSLPLTVMLAILFFSDERHLAHQRGFWVGMGLSLVGTLGISLASGQIALQNAIGIVYIVAYVLLVVVFSMIVKRLVASEPVIVVTGVTSLWIAVCFIVFSFLWGTPATLARYPGVSLLLLLSGIAGLIVGGGMANAITRDLGVIILQFTNLIVPFVTAVLEYFIFHRAMSLSQLAFGLLLAVGCGITLRYSIVASPKPAHHSPDEKFQESTQAVNRMQESVADR